MTRTCFGCAECAAVAELCKDLLRFARDDNAWAELRHAILRAVAESSPVEEGEAT